MVSAVGPECVVHLRAAIQVRWVDPVSVQNARGWRSECSRSAPSELNSSVCLCFFPFCSLPLALLSACASLSLVVLAGCQPSSSNKLQLRSSAMAHAREPEDMQSLSFQSLVPHSMSPTICFRSFMVLWQLDNPLRKNKAKSLWTIHLVTLLPYSATVVFFSTQCRFLFFSASHIIHRNITFSPTFYLLKSSTHLSIPLFSFSVDVSL